jgi:hypothetical protein
VILRISPIAAPGSLLKGEHTPKRSIKSRPAPVTKAPRRQVKSRPKREHDAAHLAAVRRCACLSCDTDPAGEAAHVRMTVTGKPIAGMGNKPDDRHTVPLCHACHMRQHAEGEAPFWAALGLNPILAAARLHAASPDVPAMRTAIFAERERRK